MSNQQILEQVIQKAIDGGWRSPLYPEDKEQAIDFLLYDYERPDLNTIIFNHDFAKALWGEETVNADTYRLMEQPRDIYPWKYHLMRMVIAEDPIAYLGEHMNG